MVLSVLFCTIGWLVPFIKLNSTKRRLVTISEFAIGKYGTFYTLCILLSSVFLSLYMLAISTYPFNIFSPLIFICSLIFLLFKVNKNYRIHTFGGLSFFFLLSLFCYFYNDSVLRILPALGFIFAVIQVHLLKAGNALSLLFIIYSAALILFI